MVGLTSPLQKCWVINPIQPGIIGTIIDIDKGALLFNILPCQNPGLRAVFNSNTHLLDKASPGEPTVVEDSFT